MTKYEKKFFLGTCLFPKTIFTKQLFDINPFNLKFTQNKYYLSEISLYPKKNT